MLPTILILSVIVIAIWIWRVNSIKGKVIKDGTAIERKDDFFRQRHIFSTTVASLQEVMSSMNRSIFDEKKIACALSSDRSRVAFQNNGFGGTFTASLDSVGQNSEDGKHLYTFQIHSWRGQNGAITAQDIAAANVVLTTIERAFLSLDQDTTVKHEYGKYKTKLF